MRIFGGLNKYVKLVGIDKAIGYTVLARIIQGGGGVLSIIFIARYLTKVEQGYYYTFGSILALQIFFELGLSGIITQYAAHETAQLKWGSEVELTGEIKYKSRLSSLLHFSVKWISVMAIFLFIGLLLAGHYFFNKYGISGNSIVDWKMPWFILSFTTACSLTIDTILSFIAGLGMVKEVAKVRFIQQSLQLLFLIILLSLNFKLYASPLALVVVLLVVPIWLIASKKGILLINIWKYKTDQWIVNYKREILPYQWRIAVSWISGYLIFQLFNPVIFAAQGAVAAGQMGMSLAVLNGILSLAISWNSTKVPLYSSLIAKREYLRLDNIFKITFFQSTIVCFFGVAGVVGTISILRYFNLSIANRFLLFWPLFLMGMAVLANQIIYTLATYLRCHKREPLLIQSLVLGILVAGSTIFLGKHYGVLGITIGFSILTLLVGLPWTVVTFNTKKKIWHAGKISSSTLTVDRNPNL